MTTKKQKVDHQLVKAMVETPCKIYQEACQKAAALLTRLKQCQKKTQGARKETKPRRHGCIRATATAATAVPASTVASRLHDGAVRDVVGQDDIEQKVLSASTV